MEILASMGQAPATVTGQSAAKPAAAAQNAGFQRPPAHTGPITALQLIARIREKTGLPAALDRMDYIIAGDPTTAVTGIATTAMATLDCLKAAVAAGRNLVITHEPVFWADDDNLDRMEGNALYKAKRDFIRAHQLVCYRLRGGWPAQGVDGIATGMAKELGWDAYTSDAARKDSFTLPPTTLLGLAQELSSKLNDRTMRIVGDPALPVTKVAAMWGSVSQMPGIALMKSPADVVIVGYTHEWETVEYAQDMIAAGEKKGLILLGEGRSEQAGMKYCAEWLKTFITEAPVDFIPIIEPYWNPGDPVFEIDTKL